MSRDEAARQHDADELPNFHAHQLADVIAAIREKRPPAVTGIEGRRVVAIIQGVYESGRTGRPNSQPCAASRIHMPTTLVPCPKKNQR